MYALPRNQRLEIRSKDQAVGLDDYGIAKFASLTGKWDGGSVSVVFAEQFGVGHEQERWWSSDLLTGATKPLTLDFGPILQSIQRAAEQEWAANFDGVPRPTTQTHEIAPGHAFITRRRKAGFSHSDFARSVAVPQDDVTIYIAHWFALGDPGRDDLDVARDAWFGHDFARAKEIVEKLIPHSYGPFLACIKLEFDMLQERTAAFGR